MSGTVLAMVSFLLCTGLVALCTYLWVRREDNTSNDGFFLAGRNLAFPVIAASLLLTNLSTEQMVGLNGSAFIEGLSVMIWEVGAVVAMVIMALFFLPKFLRSGITTVPEFMEERYNKNALVITNLIFLVAYATILLPIILYTGASGIDGILNVEELTGITSPGARLWLLVWITGIIGAIYALWGGLRTVAVSDIFNGVLLLSGGLAITYFAMTEISGGVGFFAGFQSLYDMNAAWMQNPGAFDRLNSLGGADQEVPFGTIFTGVLILNLFYWCTNQQIIQRTLAAKSLSQGQKGVLLCAAMKLVGPLYLVLPGMVAFFLYQRGFFDEVLAQRVARAAAAPGATPELLERLGNVRSTEAYGLLVRQILPNWMTGFFAAALVGAVLSSFNSALNSTCTLFSLGVYKRMLHPDLPDNKVVASGRWFGVFVAIFAMCVAPFLYGQDSIFKFLQQMNSIYFIPIFAVVLIGLLAKRVPAIAANLALVIGVVTLCLGYFVFDVTQYLHGHHFAGLVFAVLVVLMLAFQFLKPRATAWEQADSGKVKDLKPWKHVRLASMLLVAVVLLIYIALADTRVIGKKVHGAQTVEAPVVKDAQGVDMGYPKTGYVGSAQLTIPGRTYSPDPK